MTEINLSKSERHVVLFGIQAILESVTALEHFFEAMKTFIGHNSQVTACPGILDTIESKESRRKTLPLKVRSRKMIMFNSSLETTHCGALERKLTFHIKGLGRTQRGHHTLHTFALLFSCFMDSPFGMFGNYFWNIRLLIKMCF